MALDVITVPDFTASSHVAFELRTLFFLGSWIESHGVQSNSKLHLACIGPPPPSVVYLAKRAHADISIHQPIPPPCGIYMNKIRGLEIVPSKKHFLLLDTDTLFFSDPSEISTLGDCVSAAPANLPLVVDCLWTEIYDLVKLPMPKKRIACRLARMGWTLDMVNYAGSLGNFHSMLPYYNSGVIYGAWHIPLRTYWLDLAERISTHFSKNEGPDVVTSAVDQSSLATAIVKLQSEGFRFFEMPDRYHAIRPLLARQFLTVKEMAVYHAITFLQNLTSPQEGKKKMEEYLTESITRFRKRSEQQAAGGGIRVWLQAEWTGLSFSKWFRQVYRQHVEPALKQC